MKTKKRDEKNDRRLKYLGYRLLIIRECGLKKNKYKKKLSFLRI
jgi:G:T-mismatch repair DNA endonuclease (very short patch repair protein)